MAATVLAIVGVSGLAIGQNVALTDAQITQKLESRGYSNVEIIRHEQTHVDARGTKNGEVEKLSVNSQNGEITSENEKDED